MLIYIGGKLPSTRRNEENLLWPKLLVRPFIRLSVSSLENSCEYNSSYSFQWMILKPSRIVAHGT